MTETILTLNGSALRHNPLLSPAQQRADALVSSFVDHATDGYALAGMVGGGLVYRLGRVGTLALGSRFLSSSVSPLTSSALRLSSVGVGFGAEVFTFEAGQRALRVGIGGADPNLLRWSGENGLGRGLVGAAITLGSLKGAGAFVNNVRAIHESPLLQHLFQDSAMVLAHNVSGRIGITDRPRESFAEQMVNAEAILWQMNAGMSLVHGAFPGLGQLDRSLDLSIRSGVGATLRGRPTGEGNHIGLPLQLDHPLLVSAGITGIERGGDLIAQASLCECRPERMDASLRSVRPCVAGAVIDAVTRTRLKPSPLKTTDRAELREKQLAALPPDLRAKIQRHGEDYGLVVIPGLYNQPPDPAWLNLTSAAFGRGGLLTSTALGGDRITPQGLYSVIGENIRVLQPHWQMEVSVVLGRLRTALGDPGLLQEASRLVIVGYSKGGLIAHALRIIQEAYERHGGSLPQHFYDRYPGLDRIPPDEFGRLMQVLRESKVFLLGTPVEGIPYTLPVRLVDRLLLEGSARAFQDEILDAYFQATGSPEAADLIIRSQMSGLWGSLVGISHPGNILEALAYRTTSLFFYGASFLMRARRGDALIKASTRYRTRLLPGKYNHLDMVVDLSAAQRLLELIFSHFEEGRAPTQPN